MRDLLNNSTVTQSIAPQAVTTLVNGTGVDIAGYSGVVARFQVGAYSSGTAKLILEDSDDNSTYAVVTTADVFAASGDTAITVSASGIVVTVDAATEDNMNYSVGYKGGKKYLRASAIATAEIIVGAEIEKAFGRTEGNALVS